MTNTNEIGTQIGSYNIGGFIIPLVKLTATHDVRFMSQKQLFALATPAAYAELNARAVIIRGRVC